MFAPRLSIKQVDRGWDALRKAAKTIRDGENYVKVGVLGDSQKAARPGDALSNVDLALIQEYGTSTVPERSFIRSTFEAKRDEYVAFLRRTLPLLYEQKIKVNRVLGLLGAKAAADMKQTIRDHIPPPLADATIAAKGSSTPLVDTGQLINSITWAIVGRAEETE